jgi:hypothetical protein
MAKKLPLHPAGLAALLLWVAGSAAAAQAPKPAPPAKTPVAAPIQVAPPAALAQTMPHGDLSCGLTVMHVDTGQRVAEGSYFESPGAGQLNRFTLVVAARLERATGPTPFHVDWKIRGHSKVEKQGRFPQLVRGVDNAIEPNETRQTDAIAFTAEPIHCSPFQPPPRPPGTLPPGHVDPLDQLHKRSISIWGEAKIDGDLHELSPANNSCQFQFEVWVPCGG